MLCSIITAAATAGALGFSQGLLFHSHSSSGQVCEITHKQEFSGIADKQHDAFRGQSRSPNMVQFHLLGMVSYYCPIVTLSVFEIFDIKNAVTLKNG